MAFTPRKSPKYGAALLLGTVAVAGFIGIWEGGKSSDGSSVVYADKLAAGIPTVCNGITRWVTDTPIIVGQRWPAEKCLEEEQAAVAKAQLSLEKCFGPLPPQGVFDMATSHAWNFGVSATCGSLAMSSWKRGDWEQGCTRMSFDDTGKRVWSSVRTGKILPNGKPEYKFVRGLANRRDAETHNCLGSLG